MSVFLRLSSCWLKLMYKALLALLAVFTLLDTLTTKIGLAVGCVELNTVVTTLGLSQWTIFRLLLLGYLLTVFSAGYKFCSKRFSKGTFMLKTSLFMVDSFIGAIVVSGLFAIYLQLV